MNLKVIKTLNSYFLPTVNKLNNLKIIKLFIIMILMNFNNMHNYLKF